jgi:hypothetical protein
MFIVPMPSYTRYSIVTDCHEGRSTRESGRPPKGWWTVRLFETNNLKKEAMWRIDGASIARQRLGKRLLTLLCNSWWINPLLRNVQAEEIFPSQRIPLTIGHLPSNQLVAMEDNCTLRCPIYLLRLGSRQPQPVAHSQGIRRVNSQVSYRDSREESTSYKTVSSQPSRREDIEGPPRDKTSGVCTQCKERL